MKKLKLYNLLFDYQQLNESYKLTFNDKKEIDAIIRNQYKLYLKKINDINSQIELNKRTIDIIQNMVNNGEISQENMDKTLLMFNNNSEPSKPILYNQFYKENYNKIKNDYINNNTKNNLSNFNYRSKQDNKLDNFDYHSYYSNLNDDEKKSIKQFLKIVGLRVNSGDGESIDKQKVRNAFFNTPVKFQKLFAEKPSPYLWRGDTNHPCDDEYDHNDLNYLSMQSFSIYKNVAKDFGYNFTANNIKKYNGSFSIPLYIKYGGDVYNLADDEGEVLFFDVEYKCKNK